MSGIDETIGSFFSLLQKNAGGFFTPFFHIVSYLGDYGIAFILAIVVLMVFRKTRRCALIALLAIGFGFLVTNLILKNVIARPRPFAETDSPFYGWWVAAGSMKESGYSFPSGHTTLAMAFGFSLFLYFPKRYSWSFLIIPVLMGSSRLYFAVHYATDVLGGFLVGAVVSVIAYFLVKWLGRYKKFDFLFPPREEQRQ